MFCSKCGYENPDTISVCIKCGTRLSKEYFEPQEKKEKTIKVTKAEADLSINKRQALGLAGSLILFLGVFMPIIRAPIVGSLNYFQNGKGDGTIVLILAVISFILVLQKKYKGLWFTGLGSLGMLLFTFINFQRGLAQMQAQLQRELTDNLFAGLGELALRSVQLQWGWAFLVIGTVLVIATAAVGGTITSKADIEGKKGKSIKSFRLYK